MSREYVSKGAPVRRIPFALTPAEWVLCLDVKRLNDEAKPPGWIDQALDATPRSRRGHRSDRKRTSTDVHRRPTLSRAIHHGLLKVGLDVIRSRATKRTPSSEADRALEGGRTFACDHAPDVAAAELFVAAMTGVRSIH